MPRTHGSEVMAVQITCPDCDRKLKVPEEVLGRKVRCPACKSPFLAQQGDEEETSTAVTSHKAVTARGQGSRRHAAMPASSSRQWEEEDDLEEKRPVRRTRPATKKGKERGKPVALFVALGVIGLLLLGGGLGLAWY